MGEGIETLEWDRPLAAVADTEGIWIVVQAAKCLLDAVEVAPLLAGEEESLLALHRISPLVSHVEGIAGEVRVGGVAGKLGLLLEAAQRAKGPFALPKEPLLKVLDLTPIHQPTPASKKLTGARGRRFEQCRLLRQPPRSDGN